MRSLFLVMWLVVAAGCSSGSAASADPAAIERENTEGKELRNKLESAPTVK